MHPQPGGEEGQCSEPPFLQQRRPDQTDRPRLLRPDRLDVDPHSLGNLIGRQILDKDHLDDLAAYEIRFNKPTLKLLPD
jgi:hypothetical protein